MCAEENASSHLIWSHGKNVTTTEMNEKEKRICITITTITQNKTTN